MNIGIVLKQIPASGQNGISVQVRFTRKWNRVLGLDPAADISFLEALTGDVTSRLMSDLPSNETSSETESFLDLMQDSFSHLIQISTARATSPESLDTELDKLMSMYVDIHG